MAKPSAPTANVISLRLTDSELAKIDRAASKAGISRNEWLRRKSAEDAENELLEAGRSRAANELIVKHSLFQSYVIEELLRQTVPDDVGESIITDAKSRVAKFLRERGITPPMQPISGASPETGS